MALRTTLIKLSARKMQRAKIQVVACRGSHQASAFWADGAARFNGCTGRRIHRPSSASALSCTTSSAQTRSAHHPSLWGSSGLSHPLLLMRPVANRQLHARSSFKHGIGKCCSACCHPPAVGVDALLPFGHHCKSSSPSRTPSRCLATRAAGQGAPQPPAESVDLITSNANPYVKHCVKLRTNRGYRDSLGRVMVTGVVPVQEIVTSSGNANAVRVRVLFLADWAEADLEREFDRVRADRTIWVTETVMKKLTGLESVPGVHAVAEMDVPGQADLLDSGDAPLRRLLVLEQLQDPGNMGTLMRTAMAFGWDAMFLLPGCCDPFNEKVLRASRGASFRMRISSGSWKDLQEIVLARGLQCYAAEPDPEAKFGQRSRPGSEAEDGQSPKGGVALVLGNEGQGLSREAIDACTPVSLPMPGDMESLNVGIAGGLLMYLLKAGANDLLAFGSPPQESNGK